jgi:glycosyltransferase involved in cell wall biosynthesis
MPWDYAAAAQQVASGSQMTDSTGSSPSIQRARVSADGTPWKPQIAIVTITKDDAAGIRKTIASVEQQDFSEYEHVVVDGGSRTDIADWLGLWRNADTHRHILVEDPPDGIYPAMNTGIENTSAPIILILNGGDQLLPGALRRVSEHHKLHGWRWAYGGTESREPDGRLEGRLTRTRFSKHKFRAGLHLVPHLSAFVTRDLYRELGLYRVDLGTGADQEFFMRASGVAEPGELPGILSVFELGGVSSQEGIIGREVSWHRMRVASNTAFGGYPAADLIVTALLLAYQVLRAIARKVRAVIAPAFAHRRASRA